MNTIFAEKLKELRKEKGLSQKQLGEKMYVNHSTIARWECKRAAEKTVFPILE